MLIEIPEVLSREHARQLYDKLVNMNFSDGRLTAGSQAGEVKNNLELTPSNEMMEMARDVYGALMSNATFNHFALPRKIMVPIFNRYEAGMNYGDHTDVALMGLDQPEHATRTDLSITVFLSPPESYDGGELVIQTHAGENSVKLAAGDAVVYPSTAIHRVNPVKKGARISAVSWIQSYIRDDMQRDILYQLDTTLGKVGPQLGENTKEIQSLYNVFHRLVKMWADT